MICMSDLTGKRSFGTWSFTSFEPKRHTYNLNAPAEEYFPASYPTSLTVSANHPGSRSDLPRAPRQSRGEETSLKDECVFEFNVRRVDGTSALKVLAAFVLPCRRVGQGIPWQLNPKVMNLIPECLHFIFINGSVDIGLHHVSSTVPHYTQYYSLGSQPRRNCKKVGFLSTLK